MNRLIIYVCCCLAFTACDPESPEADSGHQPWTSLLDPELSQWDQYLSYRHQEGYDGSQPVDDSGTPENPIGLNKTGYDIFTVELEKEQPILKVSGEIYGSLISKETFSNYHLILQFRWGDKKWIPRTNLLKDSGILYHSIGPMGADHWRTWMMSQEFQIMEGHTGDYWNQASSAMEIRAYTPEYLMNPMAHPTQEYLHIGEGGPFKNYCLRSDNEELPHGEWNTLELICYKDKALHIVNGSVVMILKGSKYLDDSGTFQPLTEGKIQLQSEAAELFFRDIRIRSLAGIPDKWDSLF